LRKGNSKVKKKYFYSFEGKHNTTTEQRKTKPVSYNREDRTKYVAVVMLTTEKNGQEKRWIIYLLMVSYQDRITFLIIKFNKRQIIASVLFNRKLYSASPKS